MSVEGALEWQHFLCKQMEVAVGGSCCFKIQWNVTNHNAIGNEDKSFQLLQNSVLLKKKKSINLREAILNLIIFREIAFSCS